MCRVEEGANICYAPEQIEVEIMDLEGSYLEDTSTTGNILKGWDGYFQSGPQARGSARAVKIKNADRAFSDSSRTAPLKVHACMHILDPLSMSASHTDADFILT